MSELNCPQYIQLINSYNVLRQRCDNKNNAIGLVHAIRQICEYDKDQALLLWKQLLTENRALLRTNYVIGSRLITQMGNSLRARITMDELYRFVTSDREMYQVLFFESTCVKYFQSQIIAYGVVIGDYMKVNNLLQHLFLNLNTSTSFGQVLLSSIPSRITFGRYENTKNCSHSKLVLSILDRWIKKVNDREELANIQVRMVELQNYYSEHSEFPRFDYVAEATRLMGIQKEQQINDSDWTTWD